MSYLLAVITGVLLAIPFQFPKWALISWLGLIPFCYGLEDETPYKAFRLGWLMGSIFLLISGKWLFYPLINFSGYPWFICLLLLVIALSIIGLYFGLFAWITKILEKNLSISLVIILPLTWTGMEYIRTLFSFQYLFGFLSYSQSAIPELIQLAQYGGLYLVSYLIALVNVILYLGLKKEKNENKLTYILTAILIVGLIFSYGNLELNQETKVIDELQLGLIQPNIPQKMKLDASKEGQIINKINNLTNQQMKQEKGLDLLIWPETAILRNYDPQEKFPFYFVKSIPLLVGGFIEKDGDYLNSALLVEEDNTISKYYSKNRLVPWGEYVPYPNLLSDFITSNLNHLTPGTKLKDFELDNISWINPICSEILNPFYIHKLYQNNDLIINISNEAWFQESKAPWQMLQAAIFRAVEYQVPLIKVSNTGISGLINDQGEVITRTDLFTTTSLYLDLKIPARSPTIYQRFGYLFGRAVLISLALLLLRAYLNINRSS
ncbi:apolipoprotein N-acyltransferase [Halanaerobaculum tunisiense]